MDVLLEKIKNMPFVSDVKPASVDNGILFTYRGGDFLITRHDGYVLLRQPLDDTNQVVDVYSTDNPDTIDLHHIFYACDVWGELSD